MAPDPRCRGCDITLVAGPEPFQGRTYKGRLVGACRICESLERQVRRHARRATGLRDKGIDVAFDLAEIPVVLEALQLAPIGDWEPWRQAVVRFVIQRIRTADADARALQLPFSQPGEAQ